MKVKELIEYLKTKNPEDFVGMYDIGQDTGDFELFELYNYYNCLHRNIDIKSYEEVINILRRQNDFIKLKQFKDKYGEQK